MPPSVDLTRIHICTVLLVQGLVDSRREQHEGSAGLGSCFAPHVAPGSWFSGILHFCARVSSSLEVQLNLIFHLQINN